MRGSRRTAPAIAAVLFGVLPLFSCGRDETVGSGDGMAARPSRTTEGAGPDSVQPSAASGALSTRVLEETSTGRLLLAYLRCVDIDCAAALGAVSAVGPDVVPLLVQLLRYGVAGELSAGLPGDGPTVVRLRALHALGEVRDMRAGPVVCTHTDDGNPLVRAEAATALGKIGGDCALAVLVVLLTDVDQLVREMAARALGTLGRPEALPALRRGLQRERLPHVREAMGEAIRVLEGRR